VTKDEAQRRRWTFYEAVKLNVSMMKTHTKIILWVGLFVYGLLLFLALTFYRLPADEILSGVLNRMTHGKILLSAEKRSSSLWKGHQLENLTWTIDSGGSVILEPMESLSLSLNVLRFFQGYAPINMKGVLARGSFKASVGISLLRGLNKGYARIEASGIQLEDLAVLNSLAQREIQGKLRGRFDFSGTLNDLRKITGQGIILVENGAVDVNADALGLQTLPFQSLTLPLSIKNGVADLRGGEIKSPLLGGDLEGQIKLHENLQASPLQVKARVRPGSPGQDGQATKSPGQAGRPIIIELQGTIGRPLISWPGDFQ
jgi:type II secretion system protein N